MKNLKYILFLILSVVALNSCLVDNESTLELNDDGLNVVTFEKVVQNLSVTATGEEFILAIPFKLVGPTVSELTSDITVTFTANGASTAVVDDHYRIVNSTITLTKSNNYLGLLEVVMMSEGNAEPMDGTPEALTFVPPVLLVDIATTGSDKVTGSGKGGTFTLRFIPPNPFEGDYDVEMRYFHPTAGGSYPDLPDFDPDDPYGGIRYSVKTLVAETGRKCSTGFAVWPDTDVCWITCNADHSIAFEVWEDFGKVVNLGNPYDVTQVSHWEEPAGEGQIFLYYSYMGDGGYRIFWEYFTPVAK